MPFTATSVALSAAHGHVANQSRASTEKPAQPIVKPEIVRHDGLYIGAGFVVVMFIAAIIVILPERPKP
jgi:hypothetical protein